MTNPRQVCRWCGRGFAGAAAVGRPRLYCKRSCRQRDYEARQRSRDLGLGEHELVVTRAELDSIRDTLFVLDRTLQDAEMDLAQPEARKARELRRVLDYVLDAARDCLTP